MTMSLFATGIVLGVVVSVPPGPNAALCIDLARKGVRGAFPLITGAALTDAAYSLLAASGVLIASRASSDALALLAPTSMIVTAVLLRPSVAVSPRAAVGVAVFNPATAAVWLSLSSTRAFQAGSLPDAIIRSMPVAIGTAAWFTALALASARLNLHLPPRLAGRLRWLLVASLGAIGVVTLGSALV